MLMKVSRLNVFSHEIHEDFKDDIASLSALKQLKYFYNLPIGQMFSAIEELYGMTPTSKRWKAINSFLAGDLDLAQVRVCDFLKDSGIKGTSGSF